MKPCCGKIHYGKESTVNDNNLRLFNIQRLLPLTVPAGRCPTINTHSCPRIARQHLNHTCSRHGVPVNWPASSPGVNPLDFWLCGRLKTSMYSEPIKAVEELPQRAEKACSRTASNVEMARKSHLSRHCCLDIRWLAHFCPVHWILHTLKVCKHF